MSLALLIKSGELMNKNLRGVGSRHYLTKIVHYKVRLSNYIIVMRLGVRVQVTVGCGITSKGPWRSSKIPGINQALSNVF